MSCFIQGHQRENEIKKKKAVFYVFSSSGNE
jgi:hypothetical protein